MDNAQDTVKPSGNESSRADSELLESRVFIAIFYLLLGLLVSLPVLFAEGFWGFTHKEYLHLWGEGPLAIVMVVTVIVTALGMVSLGIPLLWKLHRLFTWVLVGCFVACAAIVGWQGTDSSHACFASSEHAELRASGCSYVEDSIVADQVFSYTESYALSKDVDGKTVNGTLYVVDAGYDGDRKYGHGEKVFIPKDDMKNSGYGGYSESKEWTKTTGAFTSDGNISKRYVIHTTKTQLVRPITDPQPNWEEKVEQRFGEPDKGADYVYVGEVFKNQRKHELQGAHLSGGGTMYDHVFWNKNLVDGS
jgi:hypothetical protein